MSKLLSLERQVMEVIAGVSAFLMETDGYFEVLAALCHMHRTYDEKLRLTKMNQWLMFQKLK